MSWKIIFLFFFSIISINSKAQLLYEIKAELDFVEIDNLENIYVIKGSELSKYNKQGAFLCSYANNMNGNLYAVDVTNPLRILLFYKEANVIVYVNQQLAILSDPIDIFEITLSEVAAVGSSSQGGFWVYSIDKQSLMLINQHWVKVQESQNLNSWVKGSDVLFIREYNQKVYIGLNEKVLVCDMFGSYITTLHFKNTRFFKIINGQINYVVNNTLWVFNPETKSEFESAFLLTENQQSAFCYKKRVYLLQENNLQIYLNH